VLPASVLPVPAWSLAWSPFDGVGMLPDAWSWSGLGFKLAVLAAVSPMGVGSVWFGLDMVLAFVW
jgi:hypothetical protein